MSGGSKSTKVFLNKRVEVIQNILAKWCGTGQSGHFDHLEDAYSKLLLSLTFVKVVIDRGRFQLSENVYIFLSRNN